MSKFREKLWLQKETKYIDYPSGDLYEWVKNVEALFPNKFEHERIYIDHEGSDWEDGADFMVHLEYLEPEELYQQAKMKFEEYEEKKKLSQLKRKKTLQQNKLEKEKQLFEKLKKKYG